MSDERIHLFEDFTLDLARGCLLRAGESVHLRPLSYEVLKYLAENTGRLVSKEKLIEIVWRGRAVTDDAIVQCLMEVRQALGAKGKLYLRNVRGRGYIFDPEVSGSKGPELSPIQNGLVDPFRLVVKDNEEARDVGETGRPAYQPDLPACLPAASAGAEPDRARDPSQAASKVKSRKRAGVLALAALALTMAGTVYVSRFPPREQAIQSVAVLPFVNGSGDPHLEYLSDGLSESLIDRLSQLPGVKVIARNSSFKFKGREADLKEVADSLGVEALVMGRVVQRGEELQVRAELVDTRTGTQLWGEQYSRRAADVQAVQEEIARTVSENLRPRLTGAQAQRLSRHTTRNPQAYQLYLNGLYSWRKTPPDFENIRKALNYYNEALSLDPDFALAWVGVADAHFSSAGLSLINPKEALPKAKAAAQRALELDDTLAEAHSLLAAIKQDEWDWPGAEQGHRRAIELNPNLVEARQKYVRYLSVMGRYTEALDEIKRAQELDPLRVRLRWREGIVLYLARRYDEAIEKLQKVTELEPDYAQAHYMLGVSYEVKGMYEQAIREHQKAISIEPEMTETQIFLGYALAKSGSSREARAILEKLKATKQYVSPAMLATLYLGLGDREAAIASLERAYAARDLQMQYLKVLPHFDSLRSDPRFQDLMHRIGLPQ